MPTNFQYKTAQIGIDQLIVIDYSYWMCQFYIWVNALLASIKSKSLETKRDENDQVVTDRREWQLWKRNKNRVCVFIEYAGLRVGITAISCVYLRIEIDY